MKEIKYSFRTDLSSPLDLSVRRISTDRQVARDRSESISSSFSGNASSSGRLSVDIRNDYKIQPCTISPEQIVCAPSLPGSPPQTPSPKLRQQSPRRMLSPSPALGAQIASLYHCPAQHPSMMLRQLLPADLGDRLTDPLSTPDRQTIMSLGRRLSVGRSLMGKKGLAQRASPQMFIKQGVSKCKECNIVFCKYENYLAHKKHYCSSRNLDDSDPTLLATTPPIVSPGSAPVPPLSVPGPPTIPYQQLICAACGIKFTSLDNLNAHQTYYCPKRIDTTISPEEIVIDRKCSKCKLQHDPSKMCPMTSNLYKCPICSVVSCNAAESKRHLDTHVGVKAFRCSICRYRGNTLRGMRTHIRMHFDKKSNDFNEEHYITCILEENGVEVVQKDSLSEKIADLRAKVQSPEIEVVGSQNQLHSCDECNYSSTYKGNVVSEDLKDLFLFFYI